MTLLLVFSVLSLAYANGANDNFKPVATLYGSGAASYRAALAWTTITTFAGALLALAFSGKLVAAFSGASLVGASVASSPSFVFAVALGAAVTVLIATRLGLPVSTTHALTGALAGAAVAAAGAHVHLGALMRGFAVPLLVSPILAIVITIAAGIIGRVTRTRRAATEYAVSVSTAGITVWPYAPPPNRRRIDRWHFLSAGAVAFARGLNDAPKILGVALAAHAMSPGLGVVVIAVVMAFGGLFHSRRVGETMAHGITSVGRESGLAANVTTAMLVLLASRAGVPVSTTHVAAGSLFGVGILNGRARASTIASILLAWATTLPLGAVLAASTWLLLR